MSRSMSFHPFWGDARVVRTPAQCCSLEETIPVTGGAEATDWGKTMSEPDWAARGTGEITTCLGAQDEGSS